MIWNFYYFLSSYLTERMVFFLKDFYVIVELMDDEIREAIHAEGNCATDEEFYEEYCKRHLEKYGTEFVCP